jgi:transposase
MKKKKPVLSINQLIAHDLRNGETWRSIQERYHCCKDRISKVSKFGQINNGDAPPEPKIGRPQKISSDTISYIEQSTIEDPFMASRTLSLKICESFNISIGHSTVNTIRHLLKFRYRPPRIRQQLTPYQILQRIAFCHEAEIQEIDWGSEVVISDEPHFGLFDDSRRIWIRRGVYTEETFRDRPKFELSLMLLAAIGKHYKSPLIFIDGRLDANGYIALLRDNHIFKDMKAAFKDSPVYFQQDGAAWHTAAKSKTFIKEVPDSVSLPLSNTKYII